MALPQYHRPGTLWYVSDGFVWDDLPASYRVEPGRPLECSSKLFVFNPQERMATVTARFYHVDRPPTRFDLGVGPGEIAAVELASRSEVPHKQAFWIVVEADLPVLPQARHEDFTFWDPVPDALVAVAPYPGPLVDETTWVFPDCYQGGPRSWYERELLTILNPNPERVTARVRYLLRGRELGAEEEIEIPGERVAALDVWERSPRLLGTGNGPPVRVIGDYAVRIDATGPIVAQTTRRARWTGRPSIVGARSTMGFPLRGTGVGSRPLRGHLPTAVARCRSRQSAVGAPPTVGPHRETGHGHDLWHYPGGSIIDRSVLPRGENCDVTWNLLFTHNLDEAERATTTVTFHHPDGRSTRSGELSIPPLKSDLQWLHREPWLGEHTTVGPPWAMTVTADRPVVPEVTCAEFEMWSQVCPGAMSAVNFYPGPLTDERTWWLGIGHAGGADTIPTEWTQSYHLFNPGEEPARVTLSFHGIPAANGPLKHMTTIGPGAVARIDASEIDGLPLDLPFAVRADADRPICAQTFARTFTRGLPHTRAMYSSMGVPMRL